MPASTTPDIHELLLAEDTLHLDTPQTAHDVSVAVATAIEAAKQAYRVAYSHTGGDDENETVDSLDLAINILIGVADDLN
ncbi:hypothetical protein ABT081_17165 [Streptomyces sp. NPDC002238]|uniref:hypothetical protein n=1 Tax=Streptomyces sp. NPDC002238 TaxID=3156649 RepID=UPI00332CB0C4